LKWLVYCIKQDSKTNNFKNINKQLFNLIAKKKNSVMSEKKKLRKIILINRGSAHYRW
jgi:hypothetical protein